MSLPRATESDFAFAEREHGKCPLCSAPARLRTCCECRDSAWIIDCEHYPQPRPIALGRSDGSDAERLFCDDCADSLAGSRRIRVSLTG